MKFCLQPQTWLIAGLVRHRRVLFLSIAGFVISGCSIFGDDKDPALEPVELVKFEETLDVKRIWSQKLGGGSEALRIALIPGYDGNRVYAASYDGKVSALDPLARSSSEDNEDRLADILFLRRRCDPTSAIDRNRKAPTSSEKITFVRHY